MKFCVDCKHFALNDEWGTEKFQIEHGLCSAAPLNPVTGKAIVEAHTARRLFGDCGPNARKFKAKE